MFEVLERLQTGRRSERVEAIQSARGRYPKLQGVATEIVWTNDRLCDLILRESQHRVVRGVKILMDAVAWGMGFSRPEDIPELMQYHQHCVLDLRLRLSDIVRSSNGVLSGNDMYISGNGRERSEAARAYGVSSSQNSRLKREYEICKARFETLNPSDEDYFRVEEEKFRLEKNLLRAGIDHMKAGLRIRNGEAAKEDFLQKRNLLYCRQQYLELAYQLVRAYEKHWYQTKPVYQQMLQQRETFRSLHVATEEMKAFGGILNCFLLDDARKTAHILEKPADLHQFFAKIAKSTRQVAEERRLALDVNATVVDNNVDSYMKLGSGGWDYET